MANEGKIEEILGKTNEVASITKNDDHSMEFSFKGGLVFENMAVIDEKVDKKEETLDSAVNDAEPEPEVSDDEFTLTDVFQIDEKYNTPPTPDTPTTIFRTYVPKFTEVSENYRMINDPRPRPKVEPKAADAKVNEEPEKDNIDPIAELEVDAEDVVTVSINGKEEERGDTLNVFKFADAVSVAQGHKPERSVEDERTEINKLLESKKEKPMDEPVSEPIPEPVAMPELEPVTVEEEREEPKTYSIPDPNDDMRVVDYGKTNGESRKYKHVDPEGVSNEAPAPKKRKLGNIEFNSQADRDEIKDRFLDSIMSIKIRAIAMAVIALFLVVYESYLVAKMPTLFVGFRTYLTSAVDFAFVAVIYALAIPEVARSFKYITFGRVIPEISLTVAFVVEVIYTIISVSNAAINNPLFGTIFSIFALTTVISAYYRVTADFTAFKVISRNTEKQILDKKLTRTLNDENMALDGAVDEYKSRTSRIFRAAFISDFFKRTNKVSENTFVSMFPMVISLVVSIITGVITMVFTQNIVDASSGFTMVMLLSLPAFSVLIHKLPYYDAQMAALEEDSTLIGETSYHSFSGVDVMAFDDTDIFGVDDVNLRRMMLYGDKNDMEGAMKQMSSLFASVGGPLDLIFKKTLDRKCHPAYDVKIESDGLCGMVDGARIFAGTEEYMIRHNITIPEINSKKEIGADTTKVMYAAENGEIYAKFYIRYSFSEEFTMLLPSIKEEGIVPLIYTRDPNISNELLKALSAGSDSMRVMKKYHPISDEGEKLYRRVSAELVTYGDKINAINTVLLTKKYKKLAYQLSGTELYASVFGAAIATILAILTFIGTISVPVAVFGVWQIALCVALRIFSKRVFPRADIDKDDTN